jgi:hypothetical protein
LLHCQWLLQHPNLLMLANAGAILRLALPLSSREPRFYQAQPVLSAAASIMAIAAAIIVIPAPSSMTVATTAKTGLANVSTIAVANSEFLDCIFKARGHQPRALTFD